VGDIGRDPQVRYDTFRRMDEAAGTYQVVYGRDGRLVGGVLIGDIRRAGAISKGIPQGLAFTEAERLLAG
ncbi:MAG TPA: hypothetical protein PKH10_10560, partial [bacterium]|nr:hypothetical protein [bacterium]